MIPSSEDSSANSPSEIKSAPAMYTPSKDALRALEDECDCSEPDHKRTHHHLKDKNMDQQYIPNQLDAHAINIGTNTRTNHGSSKDTLGSFDMVRPTTSKGVMIHDWSTTTSFPLPSEVLICVFDNLTVGQLLPCQLVSRQFRAVARAVLMDKVGGCILLQQQQLQQQQQRQQDSDRNTPSHPWDLRPHQRPVGNGTHGLPPLPQHHYHHHHNQEPSSVNNAGPRAEDTRPRLHQHHPHHNLYQNQSMEGLDQHPQIDLHIHHQSHSYNVSTSSSSASPSPQQQEPLQHPCRRDAGYVAPGNIALFLFPHHDHTPTGWQERQAVHFQCTEIDRTREQLVFMPVNSGSGDCMRFITNSWSLPSSTSSFNGNIGGLLRPGAGVRPRYNLSSDSNSGGSSEATSPLTESEYRSPATGLDLFDYATGHPRPSPPSSYSNRRTSIADLGSYSFTDQFRVTRKSSNSSLSSIDSASSPSHSASSLSPSASSSSSSSSLPPSSTPASRSTSWLTPSSSSPHSMTPSWAIVNGKGDEHYSVIGIKHGDWPEERQTTSRWWGGGLHTNMVRQSMVFLPWSASPGGQGSVAEFQQRLIRQHELSRQDNIMSGHRNHHRHTRLVDAPVRILQEEKDNDEGEKGCTRMHKHHMYMSCTQARNPPAHHHRYFCLHHDQLMTDIAAFNSIKAAAADFRALEPKPSKTIPLTTAGSKHLAIDYEARIAESKRCQFCLSSLCKANLEIQVNFREIRVSLDWVLSGFIPEVKQGMNMRPPSNSPEYPSSPTLQARGSGQVSI